MITAGQTGVSIYLTLLTLDQPVKNCKPVDGNAVCEFDVKYLFLSGCVIVVMQTDRMM